MLPFWFLALAASTGTAEEPYRAHGTEPFWSLTIVEGQLIFEPAAGARIAVPAPAPRTDEVTRSYTTPRLAVSINHGACTDGMSGQRYADTVFVTVGGREFEGCGGTTLAADDLADTSWHFAEIGSEALPLTGDWLRDDIYAIDFGADGFVAYGGCNRFSAAYSRTGDMLTARAPWGSTTRRCEEPAMGRERRLLEILSQPVRVSLPDPNTLLLIGESGTIRLIRTHRED
jgi:heat shock protein HslJ